MVTYFGCTIRQVAVKGFGRSKIILFGKAEIDKDRDIVGGEEDISRPEGRSVKHVSTGTGLYVLDIVVHNTPGV